MSSIYSALETKPNAIRSRFVQNPEIIVKAPEQPLVQDTRLRDLLQNITREIPNRPSSSSEPIARDDAVIDIDFYKDFGVFVG